MRATSLVPWASGLVLLSSCGTPPDVAAAVVRDAETCLDGGGAGGVLDPGPAPPRYWMSSDWNGARIRFPRYSTLRLCHSLDRQPISVQGYLSFERDSPIIASQGGNAFEVLTRYDGAPGITDRFVLVRNATAQDYYAVIVLQ